MSNEEKNPLSNPFTEELGDAPAPAQPSFEEYVNADYADAPEDPNPAAHTEAEPPKGRPTPPPWEPEPRPKVRRVGVLTMGIALIFAGVVSIISLFVPGFDIITVIRLAPAILIVLGLEIIANYLIFRDHKLKYDLLSSFLCFILILGSVTAVAVPKVYEQWGPKRYEMEQEITDSIQTICEDALKGQKSVLSLGVSVSFNGMLQYKENASYTDIRPRDYAYIHILLGGNYQNPSQFAQDCYVVMNQIAKSPLGTKVPIQFSYVKENSSDRSLRYNLDVSNSFTFHQDQTALTQLVSSNEEELLQMAEAEQQALEEERNNLANEQQQLYDELETQREALSSERQQLYDELETQREALDSERQQLYDELEAQRAELAA